ncbi:Aminotransferase, class III [Olavius algarvensis Delta 1 endosymbiont]|nr:Aminotransferase, class III [Olavius algarvensis Delta 1 endosymbiont]
MSSIVQHSPRFSEHDAVKIAKDLFALDAIAKLLPSERDQNFRLSRDNHEVYVLKIANATEDEAVLDFQNRAMTHIQHRRPGTAPDTAIAPRVCSTVNDEQIASIRDADGTSYFVRLLTYLPGKPLALVKPHSEKLLVSLGRFFGNLSQILQDFDHPATHRDFHWDLNNAGRVLTDYTGLIKKPAHRQLVEGFLSRYRAATEPQLSNLRTSVIHSDGNDYNVLVAPDGKWSRKVCGLIDFGDMVFSRTVNEVAIVCAYAMLDKVDPLAAAKKVVAGYHQAYPLTEPELAVLFDLICMRLCMSVCHSANQQRHEPDNEYLRISEKPAWELLKKLADLPANLAHYTFRQACGLPPQPQSESISTWLGQSAADFGPIVDDDLRAAKQLVIDMSVGSLLLGGDCHGADLASITSKIFGEMGAAGVSVGIGRYNEARLVYTTDLFKTGSEEMAEHRTVHLGIDLFKSSGAPVFAPLAGKVHSIQNNAAPLDYGPTIILEHRTEADEVFYTLYGHLSSDSLNGLAVGTTVEKGRQIARIGEPATNGGWTPHVHFQIILDLLGEKGIFPGVARPSEREIWLSICPDPNLVLGIPKNCLATGVRTESEILALRRQRLGRNLSISYQKPLKVVRGSRQYLYTEDGRKYLDGVNNVCHVGHCHPHVVAAGQRQMPVLNTNTRYLHDNIIEYAERLLAKFPDPLNVCFFVCTGSEANELALRLARTFTGQQDIIMVDGAYHGNTQALIDISPYKHDRRGGRGAPDWAHKVVMPDGYRGPHKGTGAETGTRYAAYVKQAAGQIRNQGKRPAAFICESMLGCGGQIVLPENYLAEAFRHVRAAGGLCLVDEVQVGFGRAGTHFWAFETQDVVPDIVTLGKPMGNGHPLAAVITTADIADAFANGMEYFNTFGGNPVSCAIGMAVLDVIEDEGLQENARRAGRRLLEGMQGLADKYPLIGHVRGLGLYAGIELVTHRETLEPATEPADYVINRLRDHGILISTDGPLDNVLKLKPPIVFSESNADEVVAVLDKILREDCLQG